MPAQNCRSGRSCGRGDESLSMRSFLAALCGLMLAAGPAAVFAQAAQMAGQGDFQLDRAPEQGAVVRGIAPAGVSTLTLDGQPVALTPEGRFLIGFDRDAGPQAQLVAAFPDGRNMTRSLVVTPHLWALQRVATALRPGGQSSEAFLARRMPELAQIAQARATDTGAQGWRQRFAWPCLGRVSGLFGAQRIYNGTPGAYHSGVDIAGATGEPVRAPADGVVILAADHPFTLEGNLLMIDHGQGLNSAFLHLSRIDVKNGDAVHQGQIIGAIGATGRVTGPHLHWSMKWRDARIDPMALAGPMPAATPR